MISTLDRIVVAVENLEDAEAAYRDLLGLEPIVTSRSPGTTLFGLDNVSLELASAAAPSPLGAAVTAHLSQFDQGLLRLVFGTQDLDLCRQALAPFAPTMLTEDGKEPGWILERHQSGGVELEFRKTENRERSLVDGAEISSAFAIDHVVIKSTDVDSTKSLYVDHLGLRLLFDREFEQFDMRLAMCRINDHVLEIAGHPGEHRDHPHDGPRDQLWGLTWRFHNANAANHRLRELDIELSEVRPGRRPQSKVFTIRSGTCGVPTLAIELEAS